jgi:Beta-lactamase enzyme family
VSDGTPRHGRAFRRVPLVALAVLVVLAVQGVAGPEPRARAGQPPDDVLPGVTRVLAEAALPGTSAVVVARQHQVVPGLSIRAADARAARTSAAVAGNAAADRPFPTASMVKLFLAEDLLHRARWDGLELRDDDPELLRRMITASDDPAASTLWVRYDGERAVRDVARRYGLTGTAPPPVPGQWGQTVTTARDLARFLSLMPVVAHPDDADAVLGWMRAISPVAADGFDQRFGLFGRADEVAVKQGWMCCVGGNRHLHSVGVVGRTVVVLLSEVPGDVGYGVVARALSTAASAVPPPRVP